MKAKKFVILICIFLFCTAFLSAQVTIGFGEQPVEGSILQLKTIEDNLSDGDVNATKGLAFPRVKLSDTYNLYPMFLSDPENPASGSNTMYDTPAKKNDLDKLHRGLMVYNISDGDFKEGLYVWNGSEWRIFQSTVALTPEIEGLVCSSAALSPGAYTADVPYTGTLTITYNNGNGGQYNGGTPITVNGLKATLQDGVLAVGPGFITYNVIGTPTVTSPVTTTFPIDFLGKRCGVTVGQGEMGRVSEYAQVNFEHYASSGTGVGANGTLATILPGNINIARVKRLHQGVFRIDFQVPFSDNNYIVSGALWEPRAYNGDNAQPYLFAPNYVSQSTAALASAIAKDTDVNPSNPTNPEYNLTPRESVNKEGSYAAWVVKYPTHFYMAEGYGAYPCAGASLSITR